MLPAVLYRLRLFFECSQQPLYGPLGVPLFVEQRDKPAADDGAGGMCAGRLECLPVGDAESYHARRVQLHGFDAAEVGQFLLVEVFLCAGNGCRRYHIDKTVGVVIDEPYALLARFGGDEHNHLYAVCLGRSLEIIHEILERQVGNDDTVDATFPAAAAEVFEPELHDGIEIPHQNERNGYFPTNTFELVEEPFQAHAVAQGAGGSLLYHGAVGHGVAERNTYLYHVDAVLFESFDDRAGAVECRVPGAEVDGEYLTLLGVE